MHRGLKFLAGLLIFLFITGFNQETARWAGVAVTPYPVGCDGVQLIRQDVNIRMPRVEERLTLHSRKEQTVTLLFPEKNTRTEEGLDRHTVHKLQAELDGKQVEIVTRDGEAAPDEPSGDRWIHMISLPLAPGKKHELVLSYEVTPSRDEEGTFLFEYILTSGEGWRDSMRSFSLKAVIPECAELKCEFTGLTVRKIGKETVLSVSLAGPPEKDLKIEYRPKEN